MARGSIVKITSPTTGRISWRARWSFIDSGGVRRHRTETRPTRKEVESILTKAQHELRSGTYVEPSPQPTGEYMTGWLDRMRHHWRSDSTYFNRQDAWKRYGKPMLDAVPLRDLTVTRIQAVFDAMTARGLGHGSVVSIQRVLNQALTDAVALGLVARNPVIGTKLPAATNVPARHWSPEEASRFLGATTDDPDAGLWTLMLYTGIRIGEALALRWSEVDLAKGTARIVRTISRDAEGREVIVEGTKTDASRRSIALVPACVAALKRHRVTQHETRLALGPGWHDLDLVFPTQDGRARHREAIRVRLRTLCRAHAVTVISPHGLRHTAATLALAQGTHPKLVQELLGHGTIAMTLDLYSHSVEGMQRDAAERIADALAHPPAPENATTPDPETPPENGSASDSRQTG